MPEPQELPLRPKLLRSRTIFRGEKLTLRIDTLKLGDKPAADKEILEHAGSAVIIPVLNPQTLLLIKQWRPAVGDYMLELPSGTREEGESPLDTAQRELREETGHRAGTFEHIGGFWPVSGYSEEYSHGYVARELTFDPLPQDKLEDIHVLETPITDLPRMIRDSEIDDALTIAALMRASLLHPEIFSQRLVHASGRTRSGRSTDA